MALGWATILLFGRVPDDKQLLLSFISLGSLGWIVLLLGSLFPDIGALLLTFAPAPEWAEQWIRIGMVVGVLVLPILIGIGGLFLMRTEDRPTGTGAVKQVLRGYPYAAVLAVTLIFMAIIAPVRKVRTLVKRWTDTHIPIVVKPGGYQEVADDLEAALDGARVDVDRKAAPRVLEAPSRLLGIVAGAGVRQLTPDRIVMLAVPVSRFWSTPPTSRSPAPGRRSPAPVRRSPAS